VNESVYLRLVDGCGWTPDEYRSWLERTSKSALLEQWRTTRLGDTAALTARAT